MLVKLHLVNGCFVHVNPEYIVEVLEYNTSALRNNESAKSSDSPAPKSSIVFNAAGHAGLNIDVLESPDQIAELCNPVLNAFDKTKNSVKGYFSKILGA